jgi:hypothetical protein
MRISRTTVKHARDVIAELAANRHDTQHGGYDDPESCGDVLCQSSSHILAELDAALESPEVKRQRQHERDRRRLLAVNGNYRPL